MKTEKQIEKQLRTIDWVNRHCRFPGDDEEMMVDTVTMKALKWVLKEETPMKTKEQITVKLEEIKDINEKERRGFGAGLEEDKIRILEWVLGKVIEE